MTEQIQISAKNLGAVALEDFCPRCHWIKLHNPELPWQIFPGIFSSIDAYTKKCVHAHIDESLAPNGPPLPSWMQQMGQITGYRKVPYWKTFNTVVKEFNILLTGVPDAMLDAKLPAIGKEGLVIPDWKTAKYTANQDRLLPMYGIQLNCYKVIAEALDYPPVVGLWLVYFEPQTDDGHAIMATIPEGFDMTFKATPVRVNINPGPMNEAMARTREIYDMPKAPAGRPGCPDCQILDGIMGGLLDKAA